MAEENTASPIAEISHEPSKFDAFLENNQKKLILLAILATLGVVAALVFSGLKDMKVQKAGSDLYRASTEDELKAVANGAPDNVQATAKLLLADKQAAGVPGELPNSYTVEPNPTAAIDTLNDLLANFPNSEVAKDATLRIAMLQLKGGDIDKAKSGLENIVASSDAGYTKVVAKAVLADIALGANQLEQSKTLYQEVKAEAKSAAIRTRIGEIGANFADVAEPTLIIKKEELKVTPETIPGRTPPGDGVMAPAGSIPEMKLPQDISPQPQTEVDQSNPDLPTTEMPVPDNTSLPKIEIEQPAVEVPAAVEPETVVPAEETPTEGE